MNACRDHEAHKSEKCNSQDQMTADSGDRTALGVQNGKSRAETKEGEAMNMPGFSADASLYSGADGYRASININLLGRPLL